MGIRKGSRGFALVAAIGVLAVLMIFAMSAAGTAEFTLGFSSARQLDRRLSAAIEEGTSLLMDDPSGFAQESSSGSSETVFLIPPREGSPADVVVSATLGLAPEPEELGPALAVREGDRLVRLEAARADGRGQRRSSLYLINSAGQRRVPILLQEARL